MTENNLKCEGEACSSTSFSEIFQLINLINKKYAKLQRQVMKDEKLTPPQYSILQLLWKKDERQFKELASACCCSQSTITGIIDTMEKNKLVTRVMHPEDRRSLLVKLTEKGNNLRESTPPIKIILNSCCEGIEPEEVQQLTILLKKLSDSFDLGESAECQV
jgi:DNA-binding MarR family transcriptional regulator